MKSYQMIGLQLLMVCLSFWNTTHSNGLDTKRDLLRYASAALLARQDSITDSSLDIDSSAHISEAEGLQTKWDSYLRIQDRICRAVIISCWGHGELILVDSLNADLIRGRLEFTMPGYHANLSEIGDINGDGTEELRLNLSGGAHGYYTSFISLYHDSLRFLTDDSGKTAFFAAEGGIDLIPTGQKGIYFIRVDNILKAGERENYTIYKWDGQHYLVKEKVVKTEN